MRHAVVSNAWLRLTLTLKCSMHATGVSLVCLCVWTGIKVKDPWGQDILAIPRLFSYVVDNPEGKDLSCIKGGSSKLPCEQCKVLTAT